MFNKARLQSMLPNNKNDGWAVLAANVKYSMNLNESQFLSVLQRLLANISNERVRWTAQEGVVKVHARMS